MRKLLCALLAALLILSCAAGAEAGIVICLNCTVNGQANLNIDGPTTLTAIANVGDGKTVTGWKVNGELVPGQTNVWLLFEADGNTVVEAVSGEVSSPASAAVPAPTPTDAPAAVPAAEEKITAVGCTIQYLNGSGVGYGQSYTELPFEGRTSIKVTADKPHSSQIAYWVIDGAKYTFPNTVKYITIYDLAQPMSFEVVYKNGASKTMGTFPNKGAQQVVSCVNANMRFIKNSATAGGQNFKTFDFTGSYRNEASGQTCEGGLIDVKVTAACGEDSYVSYWELNDARFFFSSDELFFIVKGLGETTEYVAHTKEYANPFDGAPLEPLPRQPFEPLPRDPSLRTPIN